MKMFGCTLEDCLKCFFAAEKVENYLCSRCWHAAAMKYLLVKEADEMEIEKLRKCAGEDFCNCKDELRLETLPWLNNFSCTLKQLRIARCPKILCLQVQRASMNIFGEPVKLRGHIAFPMVLDLCPFLTSEAGIILEESIQRGQLKLGYQKPSLRYDHGTEFDARVRNYMCRPIGERVCPEAGGANEMSCAAIADPEESNSSYTERRYDAKVAPSNGHHLYRLVAVVEHFGRTGSGHYTVYRSIKSQSHEEGGEGCDDRFKNLRWFCISDSEVARVSEKDVLGAEASLLFYERIV